ncbi:hypothetical protein OLQ82_02225 [Campylobacter jejuni]|nr:hypothetical protein [Campylobacter jejuni]
MDRNLTFSHLNKNFPIFFNDFFNNFKLEKNKIDEFFLQSSNNFIKTKLLELLGFKEIKQDETLENYGDTTINKLALDLANYNQKIIKTASGGGGFKTNLYG